MGLVTDILLAQLQSNLSIERARLLFLNCRTHDRQAMEECQIVITDMEKQINELKKLREKEDEGNC